MLFYNIKAHHFSGQFETVFACLFVLMLYIAVNMF